MKSRALLLLIGLIIRAKLRRSVRGARTARGAVFLSLGVIVLLIWLAPSVMSAHLLPRSDPQRTRTLFPILLMTMCVSNLVTSAGERAVAFSPAEVDLLFAAPFTRRQLLGYKIALGAFAACTASLLFSIIFLRYASFWLAGFVGVFLSFMLLQLLSMAVVMIGETIGQRAYSRGRGIALLAIGALVALGAAPLLTSNHDSLFGVAREFRSSLTARVLLAPFDVFARIITAHSIFPDMLRWCGTAVLILGALLAVVMWLDAHYLEVSAAAGQRLYERVRRVRRAGGMSLRTTGSARLRVPMPPRFAGAGPIAWRQLTVALRQSRSLLILMLLICLGGGPVLYASGLDVRANGAMIGVAFWLTMMLANALRFDFRGDVDHIDMLKSLPVAPASVAVAQLFAPALVMTALQLVLMSGLFLLFRLDPRHLLVALMLVIPFNVILFEVENIIFLLFPVRYAAGPGDLQGFGRQMVVFVLKMLALTLLAGIAAGAGGIVYAITQTTPAGIAVAWVILWSETLALVPALVGAYLRFDPSTDTPA